MAEKKNEAKLLSEKLLSKRENAAQKMTDKEIKAADDFCEGYKSFLNAARTEREATEYFVALAKKRGFEEFAEGKKYAAGSRVYKVNRGKSVILAVIGEKDVKHGVRIAAAHIDSPRLDLKPNPLYEDSDAALFKTHYYGGIKKYQWTAIPLALHGVIIKKDGTSVKVNIGDEAGEPQFVVTDLLPHLAAEQMKRTLNDGVKGEELNILVGSRPFRSDEGSSLVKLNVMKLLNEKYGIIESDFLSAELEAVPAFKASDIGFDRSMIGSYGHDDRVCAYPAAMAALDVKKPEYTLLSVLTDKEETGSDGNTGLNSSYMKYFINDLAKMQGASGYEVLRNSTCLSADVNAAFDPTFPEVADRNNFAFINHGVVVTKYTGRAGKSGTSDASAEFVGKVRRIFDGSGVIWQTGELGKVDIGGGGTVAKYIANLDVDVVDVGVPVLSMHAPFEVVSKIDVYMAYRAFLEYFKAV
ncbi:MAG: aminopeptidase [Clostridiales bacterium]|nr:aminopeptidase [Clostridiales bacterium]